MNGSESTVGESPKRERSWWGWGWVDAALSDAQCASYGAMMPGLAESPTNIPKVDSLDLRAARISVPTALESFCSTTQRDRASHAMGKAYRDVVRALAGQIDNPPDVVAFPREEADVIAMTDWANANDVVVVPFGGGSSVVGGVECRDDDRPIITVDLTGMNRVLDIDTTSLSARIQGGALGPTIEDQLRPHGYTLRHFPQSFEFSTLGGWIATRAGGHYATLHTHIDDFVESLRVVTPVGVSESWRLPGSGAGPSPDRMMIGSEGTLGFITEAWMRIQRRPAHKASTSVTFGGSEQAFNAVREIAQSGIHPANCRLLDPGEAALSGASQSGEWVLVLGVESPLYPVEHLLSQLVEIARANGGLAEPADRSTTPVSVDKSETSGESGDAASEAWKSSFLRMPYMRDGMARMGAIVETFETATTWDQIEDLYESVGTELAEVIQEVTGAPGLINCRLTHVYPDGAAPYFTVIAVGRKGAEVAMWDEIKSASMDVLTAHRATVTHHHAVGRDHRPGYDRQRPDPFAMALRGAKAALDPKGILNPGVLVDI